MNGPCGMFSAQQHWKDKQRAEKRNQNIRIQLVCYLFICLFSIFVWFRILIIVHLYSLELKWYLALVKHFCGSPRTRTLPSKPSVACIHIIPSICARIRQVASPYPPTNKSASTLRSWSACLDHHTTSCMRSAQSDQRLRPNKNFFQKSPIPCLSSSC